MRVGKALLRRVKIVRVLLIMLHDEIAQVIGEGNTSRLCGGGELRLYLLRHVERYRHAFRLRDNGLACNAVLKRAKKPLSHLTL